MEGCKQGSCAPVLLGQEVQAHAVVLSGFRVLGWGQVLLLLQDRQETSPCVMRCWWSAGICVCTHLCVYAFVMCVCEKMCVGLSVCALTEEWLRRWNPVCDAFLSLLFSLSLFLGGVCMWLGICTTMRRRSARLAHLGASLRRSSSAIPSICSCVEITCTTHREGACFARFAKGAGLWVASLCAAVVKRCTHAGGQSKGSDHCCHCLLPWGAGVWGGGHHWTGHTSGAAASASLSPACCLARCWPVLLGLATWLGNMCGHTGVGRASEGLGCKVELKLSAAAVSFLGVRDRLFAVLMVRAVVASLGAIHGQALRCAR